MANTNFSASKNENRVVFDVRDFLYNPIYCIYHSYSSALGSKLDASLIESKVPVYLRQMDGKELQFEYSHGDSLFTINSWKTGWILWSVQTERYPDSYSMVIWNE